MDELSNDKISNIQKSPLTWRRRLLSNDFQEQMPNVNIKKNHSRISLTARLQCLQKN